MYTQKTPSVIDLVEEYLEVTGWKFKRQSADIITFDFVGSWNIYKFTVAENHNLVEALIKCQLAFTIPKPAKGKESIRFLTQTVASLRELFDLIHGDMPRGMFYSLPLSGQVITINWIYRLKLGDTIDELVLEDTLNEALEEIDEFYPSLRQVLTGTMSAESAYGEAIPEPHGHA